jgi:hypothetical protein
MLLEIDETVRERIVKHFVNMHCPIQILHLGSTETEDLR